VLDLAIVSGIFIALGVPVWAIVDAAGHLNEAYQQIGSHKITWIVLLVALTLLFNPIGIIGSVVYLASVRPRLRNVDKAGISGAFRPGRLEAGRYSNALASDADRERVTEELRGHFQAGWLSFEDLSDRPDVALHARRLGDLRRALSNLSAELKYQQRGRAQPLDLVSQVGLTDPPLSRTGYVI